MRDHRPSAKRSLASAQVAVLVVCFLCVSGCLRKASLGVWTACPTSLPGAGNVVLVGVADDRDGCVTNMLSERMANHASWEVVDATTLSPIRQVSAGETADIDDLVQDAADADVELLVSATVEEAVVERPSSLNVFATEGTARVRLRFAAYGTADEEARVVRTITKSTPVPLNTTELSSRLFETLASAAVDDFLNEVQPKNASITLMLAKTPLSQRGGRAVRLGNSQARRGRWSVAAEYYESAIKANPENDAAVFNLALAAVTDRRFDEAERLALSAIRMRHDPVYVDGLEAIQDLADEDQKVRYQTGEE